MRFFGLLAGATAVSLGDYQAPATTPMPANVMRATTAAPTLPGGALLRPGETPWEMRTGQGCAPKCHWVCDNPSCPQVCKPLCHPPSCETHCKPLGNMPRLFQNLCQTQCPPPKCKVLCPATCESSLCPECRTVCAPSNCTVHCSARDMHNPNCHSTCGKPVCESSKCENKLEGPMQENNQPQNPPGTDRMA